MNAINSVAFKTLVKGLGPNLFVPMSYIPRVDREMNHIILHCKNMRSKVVPVVAFVSKADILHREQGEAPEQQPAGENFETSMKMEK